MASLMTTMTPGEKEALEKSFAKLPIESVQLTFACNRSMSHLFHLFFVHITDWQLCPRMYGSNNEGTDGLVQ
jgi:hypothetical protein